MKRLALYILIYTNIGLVACFPQAREITSEEQVILTVTQTPSQSAIGDIDSTPNRNNNSQENVQASTPTPTSSSQSTEQVGIDSSEDSVPKMCLAPPLRFNFREALNIKRIAYLRFENDGLLTFEGWTDRPEAQVRPVTPEPTPEFRPVPNASSRVLLVGGQLNIINGQFDLRPLDVTPPLNNPCGEECPLEVISQSPNDDWQLIQVSDWLQKINGIWLVSQDDMIRLVPYVFGPRWRWSTNNDLLWFTSSNPNDVGTVTIIVSLDPLTINNVDLSALSPLDAFRYFVDFSPIDGTVQSVPSFEQGINRTEELYSINLHESLSRVVEIRAVPGIVSADWNEATEQFLVQVISSEGVELQDALGNVIAKIPRQTFEVVMPSLAETDVLVLSNPKSFALSTSKSKIAAIRNGSEIWIFDCE